MSDGAQRNRRLSPRQSSFQGTPPRWHFACAVALSGLLHAAVLPLSWDAIPLLPDLIQPEPPTPQLAMVELIPEVGSASDFVEREENAELQQLQSFHDSALARAAELEQTITDALDQQAEAEVERQQQLTALQATQADLNDQVESLTTEQAELAAQLASERQRRAELEQRLQEAAREKEAELSGVKGTYNRLVAALKGEIAQKDIALHQAKEKLVLTILDRVLFPSGQATLSPEGRAVLKKVGGVLTKIRDRRIHIEGHTDNVPIGPILAAQFPTNWELSTARATEVIRYLISETQLPASALSAVGRADTTPVASNESEEGRKQNRRIEIILLPPDDPPSNLS
ncbi:MAG: OmpA family protein [Candidatus Binatia bacterium]